jgi:hypothetical protein
MRRIRGVIHILEETESGIATTLSFGEHTYVIKEGSIPTSPDVTNVGTESGKHADNSER